MQQAVSITYCNMAAAASTPSCESINLHILCSNPQCQHRVLVTKICLSIYQGWSSPQNQVVLSTVCHMLPPDMAVWLMHGCIRICPWGSSHAHTSARTHTQIHTCTYLSATVYPWFLAVGLACPHYYLPGRLMHLVQTACDGSALWCHGRDVCMQMHRSICVHVRVREKFSAYCNSTDSALCNTHHATSTQRAHATHLCASSAITATRPCCLSMPWLLLASLLPTACRWLLEAVGRPLRLRHRVASFCMCT